MSRWLSVLKNCVPAFERRSSRDHFLRFRFDVSAHVLISCAFLRMSQFMCSFILICFGCLITCAHFLRFPLNVSAHVLISCDFLRKSQLTCSFLAISFGCLSSRAHFLRFSLDVLAHVLTQPLIHSVIESLPSHSVSQSVSHSLTSHLQSIKRAKEEERRGQ